jgi:hypothetical protein
VKSAQSDAREIAAGKIVVAEFVWADHPPDTVGLAIPLLRSVSV